MNTEKEKAAAEALLEFSKQSQRIWAEEKAHTEMVENAVTADLAREAQIPEALAAQIVQVLARGKIGRLKISYYK